MNWHGSRVTSSNVTNEFEALQTDVMRFLAILCLCLLSMASLIMPPERESMIVVAHPGKAGDITEEPSQLLNPGERSRGELAVSFESKAALLELIERGSVTIFAFDNSTLYLYQPDRRLFEPTKKDLPRYAISRADLPRDVERSLPEVGGGAFVVGLALNEKLEEQLTSSWQNEGASDLVITVDATIRSSNGQTGERL